MTAVPGGVPDGEYVIDATLVDRAGHEVTAALAGVLVVDNTLPSVESTTVQLDEGPARVGELLGASFTPTEALSAPPVMVMVAEGETWPELD